MKLKDTRTVCDCFTFKVASVQEEACIRGELLEIDDRLNRPCDATARDELVDPLPRRLRGAREVYRDHVCTSTQVLQSAHIRRKDLRP